MDRHLRSPRAKTLVAEALQAHASALRVFVARRIPARDLEDVLLSAAMRALENAGSLRDAERVLPHLYRVHRNAAVDAVRHSSLALQREAGEPIGPDDLPAADAPAAHCGVERAEDCDDCRCSYDGCCLA